MGLTDGSGVSDSKEVGEGPEVIRVGGSGSRSWLIVCKRIINIIQPPMSI